MCGNVRYEAKGDSEASVCVHSCVDAVANLYTRFSAIASIAVRSEVAHTPVTPSSQRMASRLPRARLSSTRR
jgi:hypothetical protein